MNPKRSHHKKKTPTITTTQPGEDLSASSPDLSAHLSEVERLDGIVTEFVEPLEEVPPPPRNKGGRPKGSKGKRRQVNGAAAEGDPPDEPLEDTVMGLPEEELRAFFKEILDVVVDEAKRQLEWSAPSEIWKLRMVEINARLIQKYLGDKTKLVSDEMKLVIYAGIWIVPQTAAHWDSPGMVKVKERVRTAIQFFVRSKKRNQRDRGPEANRENHADAPLAAGATAGHSH